jgi:DNA-binding transcriptional MerR regulator
MRDLSCIGRNTASTPVEHAVPPSNAFRTTGAQRASTTPTATMLIGEITQRTGVPKDTIRYYERLGLVQLAMRGRRSNNYKEYADDTPGRLMQVGQLKALGFTLVEIGQLLDVIGRNADLCEDLPERVDEKIRGIDERIRALQGYRARLDAVLSACSRGGCVATAGLPSCLCSSDPDEGSPPVEGSLALRTTA